MKKIIILIGNYGSGKTEIALNLAINAASEGRRVQLIDLDRINDYFRMSDQVKLIDEKKISLVSPTFAGAALTQTNMPAQVSSAFDGDWDLVVFDVGGDPAGALSLARYHQDFAGLGPGQLEVYDIINTRRPMSETPEGILKLKDELEGFVPGIGDDKEKRVRLPGEEEDEDKIKGIDKDKDVEKGADDPIAKLTGKKECLDAFLADGGRDPKYIGTPLPLELYMQRSWDTFSGGINKNFRT